MAAAKKPRAPEVPRPEQVSDAEIKLNALHAAARMARTPASWERFHGARDILCVLGYVVETDLHGKLRIYKC